VGHAKVITPVLPVPLEGPAYFVSHAGEEFPSLIAVLQGDNVTVDLVGSTFIDPKTDITTSTFKEVPDVPIQSFELTLPEGRYSALAANGNLCALTRTVQVKRKVTLKSKNAHTRTVIRKSTETLQGGALSMPTAFTGHNGAVIHQDTPIEVTGCARSTAVKAKNTKHKKK
jgi:hypothetical protein